ncbi:MAG: hypothetical protein WD009_03815 [Phycisphaeraceae bacterium]
MNDGRYQLIAGGLLCVAINITVNGIEACLPTFIGYILIAIGAFQMGAVQRWFRWSWPVAAALATVSFPQMFQHATPPGSSIWAFYTWTWFPVVCMETLLVILLIAGLAVEADLRGNSRTRRLAWAGLPILIAAVALWFLTLDLETDAGYLFNVLVYFLPQFYLAGLFSYASRGL